MTSWLTEEVELSVLLLLAVSAFLALVLLAFLVPSQVLDLFLPWLVYNEEADLFKSGEERKADFNIQILKSVLVRIFSTQLFSVGKVYCYA